MQDEKLNDDQRQKKRKDLNVGISDQIVGPECDSNKIEDLIVEATEMRIGLSTSSTGREIRRKLLRIGEIGTIVINSTDSVVINISEISRISTVDAWFTDSVSSRRTPLWKFASEAVFTGVDVE